MCFYQYIYYPGCRHQNTTLLRYCSDAPQTAPPAPSSDASASGTSGRGKSKSGKRKGKKGQKDDSATGSNGKRNGNQRLPSGEQNRPTRAGSSASPTSRPSATRINNDISSITEEQPLEVTVAASLTQHILKNSNHSRHSMDAMRGGFGLADWFSSTTKSTQALTQQRSQALNSQLTRQRRHANDSSDESWNSVHWYAKHDTNSAPQSLTISSSESMRGYEAVDHDHEENDTARDVEGGHRQLRVVPPKNDSYALIEQDLDSMKDYVASLRAKADQERNSRAQQDLSHDTNVEITDAPPLDNVVSVPQHLMVPDESCRGESPAAMLNRQHEQQQLKERLARHAVFLAQAEPHLQQSPSSEDFPVLSVGETRLLQSQAHAPQISYASAATLTSKDKDRKGSTTGQANRASVTTPRFAQPTQAAVMRQTLRKDSAKVDSPPSPVKSARALESKRKSLPEAWTSPGSGGKHQRTAPPMSVTSHGFDGSWDMIDAPQTLRKESSFMSPTKATTQRNIAKLGKDSTQRVSPRVKTAVPGVAQADGTNVSKIPVRAFGNASTTMKPATAQPPAAPSNNETSQQAAGVAPFASVARTTAKPRRESAEMLGPIIQRLQDKELFNGKVSTKLAGPVPKPTAPATSIYSHAQSKARNPKPPVKPAELDDIALKTRQGVGNRKVAVPPHMKARMSSAGSTATASSQTTVTTSAAQQASAPSLDQGRMVSTLRADVPEFKPIWTPQTYAQQLSLYSWQGVLDKPSPEKAEIMPSEVLESIEKLRAFKNGSTRSRGDSAGTTSSTDSQPMSKRQQQRWWGKLMSQSPPLNRVQPAQQSGLDVAIHGPATSPNGVQHGQALNPVMESGGKHVQWRLRDINGSEKQVSFGRGPLPKSPEVFSTTENRPGVADDQITGLTPLLSPESDDTGPLPSLPILSNPTMPSTGLVGMHQPFAWQIHPSIAVQPGQDREWPQSAMPGNFGWSGGDGKEIRFTGYGPYAEHDPNQPVSMQFFAPAYGNQALSHGGARAARRPREDERSPTPRVWPRSMKQWAELAGAQRVPCNRAEVVQSAEIVSIADHEIALCNDCKPY